MHEPSHRDRTALQWRRFLLTASLATQPFELAALVRLTACFTLGAGQDGRLTGVTSLPYERPVHGEFVVADRFLT